MYHPQTQNLVVTQLPKKELLNLNKWYKWDDELWSSSIRKYYDYIGNVYAIQEPYLLFKFLVDIDFPKIRKVQELLKRYPSIKTLYIANNKVTKLVYRDHLLILPSGKIFPLKDNNQ